MESFETSPGNVFILLIVCRLSVHIQYYIFGGYNYFLCVKLNRERESRKERERRNDRGSRYEKKREKVGKRLKISERVGKKLNVGKREKVGNKVK